MRPNDCLCILWPALINIDEVPGLLMRTFPEKAWLWPVHVNTWAGLKRDGQMCLPLWTSQHHIYNRSRSHHSEEDEGEAAGKWSSDERGRAQFSEGWSFWVEPETRGRETVRMCLLKQMLNNENVEADRSETLRDEQGDPPPPGTFSHNNLFKMISSFKKGSALSLVKLENNEPQVYTKEHNFILKLSE